MQEILVNLTCIKQTPVYSKHKSSSQGCSLQTGFHCILLNYFFSRICMNYWLLYVKQPTDRPIDRSIGSINQTINLLVLPLPCCSKDLAFPEVVFLRILTSTFSPCYDLSIQHTCLSMNPCGSQPLLLMLPEVVLHKQDRSEMIKGR